MQDFYADRIDLPVTPLSSGLLVIVSVIYSHHTGVYCTVKRNYILYPLDVVHVDKIAPETAVADPGFPVGGRGPPMRALFTKNACENERIGSRRGACAGHAPLDPPMK